MSDPASKPYHLPNRPMNPDFGKGVFRRRVRLQHEDGLVIGELEDCNHGFRVKVHHHQQKVTAIEPEGLRMPLTTCPSAVVLVKELEGIDTTASLRQMFKRANPKANCTHLYDLTTWAIQHANRPVGSTRQFDVSIPDETSAPTQASITLNHQPLLSWTVRQWALQGTDSQGNDNQGVSLAKGFGQWVNRTYSGDELDGALILQKGYLVANARKFDMSKLQGTPVTDYDSMLGACYSYSKGVVENASRTMNSTRDFTHCEEQLLQFK